jgi:hypothetical protein
VIVVLCLSGASQVPDRRSDVTHAQSADYG